MSAREEILGRVRAALAGGGPPPAAVRDYATAGWLPPGSDDLLDLLEDRLADYRATVRRCPAGEIAATVAAALAEHAAARVVVPPGLPREWVADPVVDDPPLSVEELDARDGVVTGAAIAIAATGTLVLDGSPDQGRRAITLVPDLHVCVVRRAQVVETVPEGLARLDPTRPLTFISGPSATSDIELNRVEGVHGPRTLVVVLVD